MAQLSDVPEKLENLVLKGQNLLESAEKEIGKENEFDGLKRSLLSVKERLKDVEKPRIMLYGIYNAGKSTLLNALAGKKLADTGDKPTTKDIKKYDWKGYQFYDTPGIDSPEKKDEEMSKKQIAEVEVVIFVLRDSGTFEEEKVYNEMAEIIKQEKELLIVLNLVQGQEDQVIAKIKTKISSNLRKKLGISKEEAAKYHILEVDAFAAFEGKLKNNEPLVEASKILDMEEHILGILKKEKVLEKGYKTVYNGLQQWINEFKKAVNQYNTEKEQSSLKDILHDARYALQEELMDFIDMNIDNGFKKPLLTELRKMCWENIDREREVHSPDDMQKVIERHVNDFYGNCNKHLNITIKAKTLPYLQNKLENMINEISLPQAKELAKSLHEHVIKLNEALENLSKVDFSIENFKADRDFSDNLLILGETLLKSEAFWRLLKDLAKEKAPEQMEKVLKEVAAISSKFAVQKGAEIAGKQFLKTGGKLLAEQGLKKLGTRAIGMAIPALNVVMLLDLGRDILKTIFSLFSSDVEAEIAALQEKERRKQEARETVLQDLQTLLEKISFDITSSLKDGFINKIEQVFKEWFVLLSQKSNNNVQILLSSIDTYKSEVQNYYEQYIRFRG